MFSSKLESKAANCSPKLKRFNQARRRLSGEKFNFLLGERNPWMEKTRGQSYCWLVHGDVQQDPMGGNRQ